MPTPTAVVKIGTSSLTDAEGHIDQGAIAKLGAEVAGARAAGVRVVIVSSGAIAAGLPVLGFAERRPADLAVLQAASAVGQSRLLGEWDRALAAHDLLAGQVLLAPPDFVDRRQYLHARQTLTVLLDLGVVPIVNENDAVADDEIRFGDNDRLAALVAHLLSADLLLLLTDTAGLLSADPRRDIEASLIEQILEGEDDLSAVAGGAGTVRGSGGMASKLAAGRMAAWSGVRAVIAAASRPGVLADALAGQDGVGTTFVPRAQRLGARKLWIAFAVGSKGVVRVDEGARRALLERGVSLLPAGVLAVTGRFDADDAVEVAGPDGTVFAKGLVRHPAALVAELAGRRTADIALDVPREVIHRDDLVLVPQRPATA